MSGPRKSDPVCGQTIDPLRARAVAIVAGERYYFCSVEHRDRFAADPERYLGQPGEAEALAALTREEPPAPAHEAEPAPVVHDLIPAAEAPLPAPARLVRFEIGGMSGPEDAERVRRALGRIPGVAQVELDVVTEIASVELRGDEADRRGDQTSARVVIEALASAGYEAVARASSTEVDLDALDAVAARHRRRALGGLGFAAVAAAIGPLAKGVLGVALLVAAAGVLGWCALPLLQTSWQRLRRFTIAEEVPALAAGFVLLGLGAASVLADWGEGDAVLGGVAAGVVALAHVARWLETRGRRAAGVELARAAGSLPPHARRVRSGAPSEVVKATDLCPGELVRVVAGEVVPADGVIRTGRGSVDETVVSAGTPPAARGAGDALLAGARVVSGAFVVEVRRAGKDTLLARVRATIADVQGSPAPLKRLAERAALLAPLLALVAGGVIGVLVLLSGQDPFEAWLATAALWAASAPLAVTLAAPVAIALAAAGGARRGILFRNAEALERAGAVTRVVVDKSGTLTADRPRVEEVAVRDFADEGWLLALAAAAERVVDSALARAIRLHAETRGVLVPPVDRGVYHPGMGVVAQVAGVAVVIGSRRLFERESVDLAGADDIEDELAQGARSVLLVAIDGKVAGGLAVADVLRPDAASLVSALRAAGMQVSLTTGDGLRAAAAVAGPLTIDDVRAGLRPDEKKQAIAKLRGEGEVVAAVGDGVADGPALAAADVGIVLARGSEVPLEAGAVTVLGGELGGVAEALRQARRALGTLRVNLAGGLGYGAVGALVMGAVALAGPLSAYAPLAAAAAGTAAVALVVGNSLRR